MLFLVSDGEIVGTTDQVENLPDGYEAVSGPDLAIEQLYFDGTAIQIKPAQPSPAHFWSEGGWRLPDVVAIPVSENWNGLLMALRGSSFFAKCFESAERTLKANAAWTLLYGTLTRTHNLEDLMFSLFKMREAMRGIAAIGDFTPGEIEQMNQILEANGFELRLSAQ
jgi:hypothetical protein